MAQRKFKMTAFARFFLVMIVVAPLAYMGASYYNGQDGVQNLKDLFQGKFPSTSSAVVEEAPAETNATLEDAEVTVTEEVNTPSTAAVNGEIAKLKDDLGYKDRRIQELYQEIEGLKIALKEKDDSIAAQAEEMKKIQDQLDRIKKAASGGGN